MFKKYRRNRKLRKLRLEDNAVVQMALRNIDRPTDFKEEMVLSVKLNLDTLYLHAESAMIAEKTDVIIAMDIRLATLRTFCSLDSLYVFQCLAAMPSLLEDPRAVRSLHTYFNRLGLPEYAESLLGTPDFDLKKLPKEKTIFNLLTNNASQRKIMVVEHAVVEDGSILEDLKIIPFQQIEPRLIRHLSQKDTNGFSSDLIEILKGKGIDQQRKREILFCSGNVLIAADINTALSYCAEVKPFISDARFMRRLAQNLEKSGRYEEAISLLESASDQTTKRLFQAISQRWDWKQHGYDLNFLEPIKDYTPVKGRVLYHIHASINHTTSGYSTRTHHICKSLIEQGVDLHVRTRWGYPCDRKEVELQPEDIVEETIDGVKYLHDPLEEAFGTYAMEEYAQRAAYSLLNTALELKPEVIHAASNHAVGFPAAMVARALNIPFIYEMRGLWALSRAAKDPIYRREERFQLEMALERHVALSADHVIAITDGLRAQLIDWGLPPEKISIAPNGVDTSKFQMQKRDAALERKYMLNGKIVIGYVGSLLKYEGLTYLFDAISILSPLERSKIAVIIVGGGEYRKALEQQVSRLGLNHTVTFTGKVPMEEVGAHYSLIDIAPFPRISAEVCEMISPLKPLEAMAMGSVVVASNVRAIAEHVIAHKNGILFEKENPQDLAEKLRKLIRNPEQLDTLAKESRSWVATHRNWGLITTVISSVYSYCVGAGDIRPWNLDVLPSIIRQNKLTGVPLLEKEINFSGPSSSLISTTNFEKQPTWEMSSNGIALSPPIVSLKLENSISPWNENVPKIHQIAVREGHPLIERFNLPFVGDVDFTDPVLLICDEHTTCEQIQKAIIKESVLFSERSDYLHGYVGILSELSRLPTIFEALCDGGHLHLKQRKENWRRNILRLHPLIRLTDKAHDRSHLINLDPLRYELVVKHETIEDLDLFVSQILCQRVKPAIVVMDPKLNLTGKWEIIVNALLVNGIQVHQNKSTIPHKSLEYTNEFDEHSGIDFTLDVLLRNGISDEKEKLFSSLEPVSLNHRILVIGHDLKFISDIAELWRDWGVDVTLVKSRNHPGDLDISDQQLMKLMGTHDIIFCEWALGNYTKLSHLRGERPVFVRYHAQELNTEYILDADIKPNDVISFVSHHMCDSENRITDKVKRIVIPNGIESLVLDVERKDPKGLGIMGITPRGKGLHRSLEMLQLVSENSKDERLLIKGKLPKEYPWMKRRFEENAWYEQTYKQYQSLFEQTQVIHEGFTPDVGHFVSSIRSILSVSDHESFHIAPLEGAAGRTLVHMLPWDGAADIHKKDWIFSNLEDLTKDYLSILSLGIEYELGSDNRQYVMENYDQRFVAMKLLGNLLQISKSSRKTFPPPIQGNSMIENLQPSKKADAPMMKIRALTHQDYDIPQIAEKIIREKELQFGTHVVLAHHVDLNLIDGSAIWYVSMAQMLSKTGVHVICMLASEAESSPLVQPILSSDNITIITPRKMDYVEYGRKLSHDHYVSMVNNLSSFLQGSTKVFCRGFDLVKDLSQAKNIELWAYLTDYYVHEDNGKAVLKEATRGLVNAICDNGGKLLCQTKTIRDELIQISGMPLKQFIELPPMIPDAAPEISNIPPGECISVTYAGKIAPLWGVECLIDAASSKISVTVIGDKIHNGPASDSMFKSRLTGKLESSTYIKWILRLPRKIVLNEIAYADAAWCARDAYFESQTRELSTKVLECILAGTPPIITKSPIHVELLGEDWPLFIDDIGDVSWKVNLESKIGEARNKLPALRVKISKNKLSYVSNRMAKLLGVDEDE